MKAFRLKDMHRVYLHMVAVASVLIGAVAFSGTGPASEIIPTHVPEEMVYVRPGSYTPLYTSAVESGPRFVDGFLMDRYAVTNADFLAFVTVNPQWQRSRVSRLFADENYLKHWDSDVAYGADSLADRPVVNVSWFAARAYAEWRGKRLPTVDEWEYAAAASVDRPDGSEDPAYNRHILTWYSQPMANVPPPIGSTYENYWGIYDLHGLVWEWVEDFNTVFVTGDSRNDTETNQGLFCASGASGASDFRDYASFIRYAYRNGLKARYTTSGLSFRCANDTQAYQQAVK